MRDMQQGVNPNRPTPRRRPTRRSASSAPPAAPTRRRPTRRRPTPTETREEPRTATLTPRMPTLIPAEEKPLPEPGETRGALSPEETSMGRALLEAIRDSGFGSPEEEITPGFESGETPHIDIAYKSGKVVQIPVEDYHHSMITDDVESVFLSDEHGEMKSLYEDTSEFVPPTGPIERPASEVIEPTEDVVEAVNEMKPLQSDMRGLPKNPNKNLANVVKPLMAEGIAEAIGPAENRDKVIARMQRKKAKPTASKQPTPPSDAEDKKATEARLSQAMSSEMEPVEGKPDPVAEAASKRLKPKNKGKGGMKMTMADLAEKPKEKTIVPSKKVKEAIKPTTEVPRLGSRPDPEDVYRVIELVNEGNKEAYTQLYNAEADLEDMDAALHSEAMEAIDEYKANQKAQRKERRKTQSKERKEAQGKDLSDPLTEAKDEKKLTSDDLAARLLNRGKKD